MAMSDHLLRFRAMTTDELVAKRTKLENLDTPFQQQSMGTKSFTLDNKTVTDQLNAIAYVLRERGALTITKPRINHGAGVMDFSRVNDPSGGDCSSRI